MRWTHFVEFLNIILFYGLLKLEIIMLTMVLEGVVVRIVVVVGMYSGMGFLVVTGWL